MALSDLIPWHHERDLPVSRRETDPFWSLHREMNRVFEDFARGFDLAMWPGDSGESGFSFHPTLDVSETDEEIRLTADLPGIDEKDIDLSVENGRLTLRGERRYDHDERRGGMTHRSERAYGSFQRSVSLPCEVDMDKADAKFKQGVLTVNLPKAESARRNVRHIDVKAG